MSDTGIFIVGAIVTLLVAAALVPLFWAAVLDGRTEREYIESQQAEDAPAESERAVAG